MAGTKFKVKKFETHQDGGVQYEFGAEINQDFPIEAPGGAAGKLVVNNDLEVEDNTVLTGNLTVGSQGAPSTVEITGDVTINAEDSVNIVVEADGSFSEVFKVTNTDGLSYFKINPGSAPTSGEPDTAVYANGYITTRDIYALNDLSSGNTLSAVTKATAPLVEVNTVTPNSGQEVTLTNNNDSDGNQVVGLKINDSEHSSCYVTLSEGTDGDGVRFAYSGNTNEKLGLSLVNWGAIQGLDDGNAYNVLSFGRNPFLVNLEAGVTLSLAAPTEVDITTTLLDINADRTDVSGNLLVNTLSPISGDTLTVTNVLDSTSPREVNLFIKDAAHSDASLVIGEGDASNLDEATETGVILGSRIHYSGTSTNITSIQGLYKDGSSNQTYNTVMSFDREGDDVSLVANDTLSLGGSVNTEIQATSSNFVTNNAVTKIENPSGTLSMSGDVLQWSAETGKDHTDLSFKMDAAKFKMGNTPDLATGTTTKYAFNITCPFAYDGYSANYSDVLFESAGNHHHVVRDGAFFRWGRDSNLDGTIGGIFDGIMQLDATGGQENLYVEGTVNASTSVSQFTGSHLYFSETEIVSGMALELHGERVTLSSSTASKICCGTSIRCFPIDQVDPLILSSNSLGIAVPETGYLVTVASVGDSRTKNCEGFNVCNENGDIAPGDLLVTSSTPGYLMKQDDDIIRSCTVGKAMENVIFNEQGQAVGVYGYLYCG